MSIARTVTLGLLSLLVAGIGAAAADPPDHAPAHGWRRHHDHREHADRDERGDRDDHDEHGDRDDGHRAEFVGYTGARWDNDYEILSGRCNREAVATVVGGVVGGVLAAHASSSDNRTVATLIGAAAGALIGRKIGHELDEADRGCFGHALEIGPPGRRVVWTNQATGVRYEMVPGNRRPQSGATCREFTLLAIAGNERSTRAGIACRAGTGVWRVGG